MKLTGLFAGAALAALGFSATAQEAAPSAGQGKDDASQREVRLAICAFGTAETMVPVEEWLGKTIHPGQYADGRVGVHLNEVSVQHGRVVTGVAE